MRTSRVLPVVLVCGLALPAAAQPDAALSSKPAIRFDGHKLVRMQIRSARDMQVATALTDDVWSERAVIGGTLDIRVTPDQFRGVQAAGVPFEVVMEDVQAAIDAETARIHAARLLDGPGFFDNYHTYDEINAYFQGLAAAHPNLATVITLGNSIQGRPIFALRITGPGNAAGRPAALFNGCQHAREWITPATVTYIADQLLTRYAADPEIARLVNGVEFILVPIVNPDGYVYTWTNNRLWRKNRQNPPTGSTCRGVDLNRNWGHQWGGEGSSNQPCNDAFRGLNAFSAQETQVLRDYILARPNIQIHLDFHSYGQLVMSPWAYTAATPPDHELFMALNQQMAQAIFSAYQKEYEYGPIYTTIYPAAGSIVDWVYGGAGRKSFTIEVRDNGETGFLLPADQILPTAEENFRAILVLADHVAPCYANCDQSTSVPALNILDFNCFLNRFSSGDPYANCDGSTGAPTLNVLDFNCFLNAFSAGCP